MNENDPSNLTTEEKLFDVNEKPVQANEENESDFRLRLKDWESTQLPENPSCMTFRDRYQALDSEMIKLAGIDQLPDDSEIKILDFAGGIMPFGSPTAHDLVDIIGELGKRPVVSVVDRGMPDNLDPDYPEVSYAKNLDSLGDQSFDIIRTMHLIEHLPFEKTKNGEDYSSIREALISHLAEGGLFISTQMLARMKNDEKRFFPKVIKIMQKRDGVLVPIAILPDPIVPWPPLFRPLFSNNTREQDLAEYSKYRQDVLDGTETIPKDPDEEGYELVLRVLSGENMDLSQILNKELSLVRFLEDKGKDKTFAKLEVLAAETAKFFAERKDCEIKHPGLIKKIAMRVFKMGKTKV